MTDDTERAQTLRSAMIKACNAFSQDENDKGVGILSVALWNDDRKLERAARIESEMPEATLQDFSELAGLVAMQQFPIMPKPEWGQDAAYLGFFIDTLRGLIEDLRKKVGQMAKYPGDLGSFDPDYYYGVSQMATWAQGILDGTV